MFKLYYDYLQKLSTAASTALFPTKSTENGCKIVIILLMCLALITVRNFYCANKTFNQDSFVWNSVSTESKP